MPLVAFLPDIIDLIISALNLEDLMGARLACHLLHNRVQRRFLPVIPPPTLARVNLTLEVHGRMLVHLFGSYRKWIKRWFHLYFLAHPRDSEPNERFLLKLRSQRSELDAFFSLNPWARSQVMPRKWKPLKWLQAAFYDDGQ